MKMIKETALNALQNLPCGDQSKTMNTLQRKIQHLYLQSIPMHEFTHTEEPWLEQHFLAKIK